MNNKAYGIVYEIFSLQTFSYTKYSYEYMNIYLWQPFYETLSHTKQFTSDTIWNLGKYDCGK